MSTHHPPQLNVLVVGEDEDDVARLGTVRTPDAAGEQRPEQQHCEASLPASRLSGSAHQHRHQASTAPGLVGPKFGVLQGGTVTGREARGAKFKEVENLWSHDRWAEELLNFTQPARKHPEHERDYY